MTHEPPIPRTLYKYVRDIDAVKNIIQGKIKFASFYELNDATEATSVGDDEAIKKDHWEIQNTGLTQPQFNKFKLINKYLFEAKLANDLSNMTIDQANNYFFESSTKNVKGILGSLSNDLKGSLNQKETHSLHYFCLSERYDSLPMWAHYSKRGNGFVVVFSNLDQLFTQSEPWHFDGLHRVRYRRLRPPITFDPMTMENLFLTKTSDWEYEKEIRVIKPAKDLEFFSPPVNLDFPMKYLQIDAAYVSGVICGYQIDKKKCPEIADELVASRPSLPTNQLLVSQAMLQNDGQINIERVRKIANK